MKSQIQNILKDIDLIYNRQRITGDINSLLQQSDDLSKLVDDARQKYNIYMGNSTDNMFKEMIKSDDKLAELLENNYVAKTDHILSIEVISGDKLKEKLDSTDKNIAAIYSSVRYIVTKEFAIHPTNNNIVHRMVLGKYVEDFLQTSKWFILYDNDLIVSVLCYLSNNNVDKDGPNDNLQSFATRSDRDKIKFRSQGYNQILMKYTVQYLSKLKCDVLKLGVEPHNFGLLNVYNKVGFEYVPILDKPIKYMKYECPKFETIKFRLPEENKDKLIIPSFDLPQILLWPGSTTTGYYFENIFNNLKISNISTAICTQPDPTNKFNIVLYRQIYDKVLEDAKNKFMTLSDNQKLEYYNKAKQLAELNLWEGNSDLNEEVKPRESGRQAGVIGLMDDIYQIVKKFKPGYENNYYMTYDEYKTNDDLIKIRVAKRYYITQYLIDNIKLNGVSIHDGIQKWRQAYYDIRMIFIKAMRKRIKADINFVINPNFDEMEKTLGHMESIFSNCLQPHSYFNVSLMRNGSEALFLDYINKNNYPTGDNEHKFISMMINPNAHLAGEIAKSTNHSGLSQEQVIEGIAVIYLLTWEYEHFLTNMMHEIMHTFRDSDNLNLVLFDQLYPYIDELAKIHPNIFQNQIRKLEMIADIIAFSAMSILLEHSDLSNEQQYTLLKKAPLPICGTQADADHPSGHFRVNTLRIIPHIANILSTLHI